MVTSPGILDTRWVLVSVSERLRGLMGRTGTQLGSLTSHSTGPSVGQEQVWVGSTSSVQGGGAKMGHHAVLHVIDGSDLVSPSLGIEGRASTAEVPIAKRGKRRVLNSMADDM